MINKPLPIHKDYNRDPYIEGFKGSNGDPNIKACKRVMLGILILRPLEMNRFIRFKACSAKSLSHQDQKNL